MCEGLRTVRMLRRDIRRHAALKSSWVLSGAIFGGLLMYAVMRFSEATQ